MHPKCENMGLTSLTFGDDLFILADANVLFVKLINNSLMKFQVLSGLKPNLYKSEIFIAGVFDTKKGEFAEIMEMPLGALPIKYPGVPLIIGHLILGIVHICWTG